jgi:hypothetical protein
MKVKIEENYMVNQLTGLRKVSQTLAYKIIFTGACPNQSMKKNLSQWLNNWP